MIVRCGSPTCTRSVSMENVSQGTVAVLLDTLGWCLEQQENDDVPQWYCQRCVT